MTIICFSNRPARDLEKGKGFSSHMENNLIFTEDLTAADKALWEKLSLMISDYTYQFRGASGLKFNEYKSEFLCSYQAEEYVKKKVKYLGVPFFKDSMNVNSLISPTN